MTFKNVFLDWINLHTHTQSHTHTHNHTHNHTHTDTDTHTQTHTLMPIGEKSNLNEKKWLAFTKSDSVFLFKEKMILW